MVEVKKRSRYVPVDDNTLERIFKITDRDAGAFVDNLMGEIVHFAPEGSDEVVRKIVEGKPDAVTRPKNLAEHISGFIRIFCGWHDDDYVWHIEHAAIRRPWRVPEPKVIYLIATTMHEVLPYHIQAKIWLPQQDWELRTITFKAMGVGKEWSFSERDVEKINSRLFEILNPLV